MEKELGKNNEALKKTDSSVGESSKSTKKLSDEIDDSADDVDDSTSTFEKLGDVCKVMDASIADAFAAVSAAAISAGKALVDMAKDCAAYADSVLTEATVTGIATDKLQ